MQVGGPIPFHVARAYGLKHPARALDVRPTARVSSVSTTRAVDTYRNSAQTDQLVAGKVPGPVEFDTPFARDNATLQLYNRAADKIEAAVAVQLGRTIDITG